MAPAVCDDIVLIASMTYSYGNERQAGVGLQPSAAILCVPGDIGMLHAVSSSCCQCVTGPDTTARVFHTNEQGVLAKPPHHERHH